jgi:hypothetical protein
VVGIKASLSPLSVLKQCAFLDGSTSVADGAREGSGKLQNWSRTVLGDLEKRIKKTSEELKQ